MKRRPFTFVEVLVAVIVMALIVPVAVRGISIARRLVGDDERLELAARLADEKLNELIVTGDWQGSEDEGVFEDEPQYQWTLTTDTFDGNEDVSLTVVTVTVSFVDAARPTSVSLSTLASSTVEAE
jgi:type II secretory pathway pseudopilin PulG